MEVVVVLFVVAFGGGDVGIFCSSSDDGDGDGCGSVHRDCGCGGGFVVEIVDVNTIVMAMV
jgi:hypothetical protein